MEISSVSLVQSLWQNYETSSAKWPSSDSSDETSAIGGKAADRSHISSIGKFSSEVSRLSGEEREEMRAFYAEMQEAVKNGTFDASEMAAEAPDALKSFAEDNGIELETLLTDQASGGGKMQKPMGPPPPMPSEGLGSSGSQLNVDEEEELLEFYQEMMAAVKDGTFDASESADEAPDVLKSYAEENGIDLESLLAEQADELKDREARNGPPPPPIAQTMYGNYGYDQSHQSQGFQVTI